MNITELEGNVYGDHSPLAVTLKMGPEVVKQLKQCAKERVSAKLIVSKGHYMIRVGEDLTYSCTSIPENLNVDLYSGSKFCGRISHNLGVLDNAKKAGGTHRVAQWSSESRGNSATPTPEIAEPNLHNFHRSTHRVGNTTDRQLQTPESASISSSKEPELVYEIKNQQAYQTTKTDSKSDVLIKFLAYLALGPSTQESLVKSLKISPSEISLLLKEYAQIYNKKDTFISDDKFPIKLGMGIFTQAFYILKDKSYKEIRPSMWPHYSDYERGLITKNINNALSRLGYSESHPIRRKIFQDSLSADNPSTKKSSLGGGILISKKSGGKRAQTESPKLPDTKNISPQKHASRQTARKRKFSSSTSSSDDEKLSKKSKVDSETSPSSINEDTTSDSNLEENEPLKAVAVKPTASSSSSNSSSDKKLEYYHNLAVKFKSKYREYQRFYMELKSHTRKSDKKDMVKLFELHNSLLEWKRKLWNFDSENKAKHNIMNLSKHKKTPSFIGGDAPSSLIKKDLSSAPSPLPSKPSTPSRRINKNKEDNASFSRNKMKVSLDY